MYHHFFNLHFWQTIWHIKSIFASLVLVIIVCALLIAFIEHISFQHALYFAFITGLTIGYGDIVPATGRGQIVSVLLGLIGILFTGLIVAVAVRALQLAWKDLHGDRKAD